MVGNRPKAISGWGIEIRAARDSQRLNEREVTLVECAANHNADHAAPETVAERGNIVKAGDATRGD